MLDQAMEQEQGYYKYFYLLVQISGNLTSAVPPSKSY